MGSSKFLTILIHNIPVLKLLQIIMGSSFLTKNKIILGSSFLTKNSVKIVTVAFSYQNQKI